MKIIEFEPLEAPLKFVIKLSYQLACESMFDGDINKFLSTQLSEELSNNLFLKCLLEDSFLLNNINESKLDEYINMYTKFKEIYYICYSSACSRDQDKIIGSIDRIALALEIVKYQIQQNKPKKALKEEKFIDEEEKYNDLF